MITKLLILSGLIFIGIGIYGCNKDSESDDPVQVAACEDTPINNGACQAYFERWFFNKDGHQCELIGYSGCNQVGFGSESECEAAKCK